MVDNRRDAVSIRKIRIELVKFETNNTFLTATGENQRQNIRLFP